MNRINFAGTIASVSALGIRDAFGELTTLNISILVPVSYVNGKPLREPVWASLIISPHQAAELGLEIKAKSLNTPNQQIDPKELAEYGLSVTEAGTVGIPISFQAVGLNKAKAREVSSPGLNPITVYPAVGVTNIQIGDTDDILTDFETVESVEQTTGYRPPSAVMNFVQKTFSKNKSNAELSLF